MDDTNNVEDFTDRIASHPDDPDAPFADRLLLALGVHPNHVTGPAAVITEDDAVAIAAQFRSDAHRYPMVCEDYGTQRDEAEGLTGLIDVMLKGMPVFVLQRADGAPLDFSDHPWQVVAGSQDLSIPAQYHGEEPDEPAVTYRITKLSAGTNWLYTVPSEVGP